LPLLFNGRRRVVVVFCLTPLQEHPVIRGTDMEVNLWRLEQFAMVVVELLVAG
jgi:hypothetical protein